MALTDLTSVKNYLDITGSGEDTRLSALITIADAMIEAAAGREFSSATHRESFDGGADGISLSNYPVTAIRGMWAAPQEVATLSYTSELNGVAVVDSGSDIEVTITYNNGASVTGITLAYTLTAAGVKTGLEAGLAGLTVTLDDSDWSAIQLVNTYTQTKLVAATTRLQPARVDYTTGRITLSSGISGYKADAGAWGWQTGRPAAGMGVGGVYREHETPYGRQNIIIRYTAGYATIPSDIEQLSNEVVQMLRDKGAVDTALASESLGSYSWSKGATAEAWDHIKLRIMQYARPFIA